ncbi:MAG: IS30 family transposase, partial [Lactobacillaceae bacterium]|nr:IS30 family transposase [Lactobacillaceae bacterium]
YREIEELFGLVVYFPDAHSPWERGTNENTNGLVREYIPKSTDLSNFTSDEIKKMVSKINNRPRKCLGFKTPFEFFFNKSFHLA